MKGVPSNAIKIFSGFRLEKRTNKQQVRYVISKEKEKRKDEVNICFDSKHNFAHVGGRKGKGGTRRRRRRRKETEKDKKEKEKE